MVAAGGRPGKWPIAPLVAPQIGSDHHPGVPITHFMHWASSYTIKKIAFLIRKHKLLLKLLLE